MFFDVQVLTLLLEESIFAAHLNVCKPVRWDVREALRHIWGDGR